MVHEAVLDYFAQSVWYEPNCVNELAKAQNMAVSQIKCAVAPPNTRPSLPLTFLTLSAQLRAARGATVCFYSPCLRGAAATHHWCAHCPSPHSLHTETQAGRARV